MKFILLAAYCRRCRINGNSVPVRGKSDKPYLQRRIWRNQTDLTTDSKQNVSLNQSLWRFLTQFQAKMLTGLSWNTESHHLWIIYNEFSSLHLSECSACCPEISCQQRAAALGAVMTFLTAKLRLNHGGMVWMTGYSDWLQCSCAGPKGL